MTSNTILRRVALSSIAALALAACGSDNTSTSESPEPSETIAPVDEPVDADTADEPAGDAAMVPIGSGNLGGTVVDPKPYAIDSIDILESFPEQLAVNFTGGDANCTAADATASITGDVVLVELQVGITEDALTRSCLAGNDVAHTVSIGLDQGLEGRDVVAADPG